MAVFLPLGVLFGVELKGERGEGGEHFVEFALEDVEAGGVEHPVAASVAGVYPGEHGHGVACEFRLEHTLHALHRFRCGAVGHSVGVAVIDPYYLYAESEPGVVDEFLHVAAPGDHYQSAGVCGALGGCCPVVGGVAHVVFFCEWGVGGWSMKYPPVGRMA